MNILFTCVGRRVELIQAFRDAAFRLGLQLRILGSDMSQLAPVLVFCDEQVIVPPITDDNYIQSLLDICMSKKIDALIPTIDSDLIELAKNKHEFIRVGTRVIISDPDKVFMCRDKRKTSEFFIKCGLHTPITVDDINQYTEGFPCLIKPTDGSASKNAFRIESKEELLKYSTRIPDYIIQPYIEGTEYTVDIFCDFYGNPIYITPRERIEVRNGEVQKTRIIDDELIVDDCKKLIDMFKPCGAITVQLIRQKDSGIDNYIEINPRFGGGAPLSIKAGADAAEALLRLLCDKKLFFKSGAAQSGMTLSRYDQSVIVESKSFQDIKAVIFDLDDTLYPEKDYVRSGFHTVANMVPGIGNAFEKLWSAFETGQLAIDSVLKSEGIYTDELKASCLKAYRFHKPDIRLYDGVEGLLSRLRHKSMKLGIITDGRSEGQHAKIDALGLQNLVDEIIITDELGGEQFRKPCDIAFQIMQRRLKIKYEQMVYIGDNISKDFYAPKNLGINCIFMCHPDSYNTKVLSDIGLRSIRSISHITNLNDYIYA